jgi:hypothetical protein
MNDGEFGIATVGEFVDQKPGYMIFGRFQPSVKSLVSDAEDAEIIAHEYGHAILSFDANGKFGTEKDGLFIESEARAISEGFSDFWAMSTFAAKARASRHDVRCFAAWGHAGTCYRVIGGLTSHDQIKPNDDPHTSGEVWSGVLADILTKVFKNDRNKAEHLILEGHLRAMKNGYVPTMNSMADGVLETDLEENNWLHERLLCRIFKKHGLEPRLCCGPNGCLIAAPP